MSSFATESRSLFRANIDPISQKNSSERGSEKEEVNMLLKEMSNKHLVERIQQETRISKPIVSSPAAKKVAQLEIPSPTHMLSADPDSNRLKDPAIDLDFPFSPIREIAANTYRSAVRDLVRLTSSSTLVDHHDIGSNG